MEEKIRKQYDDIGREYVRHQRGFFAQKDDWTRLKMQAELKAVNTGRVLDIGCGGGDDVKWCEEQGIEAYGIDESATMCDIARETVAHPQRIQQGDYEHISFPDQYFDVVFGRFSLHFLTALALAYKETARVLKPHGKLLIAVSHPAFDAMRMLEAKNQSVISMNLYNDAVTVTFPPHKLSDYFSGTFFEFFELQEIGESPDEGSARNVPKTLYFKAAKRL